MFVAIEGLDASGKATQAKKLAEWARGYQEPQHTHPRFKDVIEVAFPAYESVTGKAILEHLKRDWVAWTPRLSAPSPHDALVFQALQSVNRLECLPEAVWKQRADALDFIIADRYTASAEVYGSLDGLSMVLLDLLNKRFPRPDLYFLLDIPVEESVRRRPERRDRYEANIPFMRRVRDRYLEVFMSRRENGYCIVNGQQDVAEVHATIVALIKEAL